MVKRLAIIMKNLVKTMRYNIHGSHQLSKFNGDTWGIVGFSGPCLKNAEVIAAWKNGASAHNHRQTLSSLRCEDGSTELFSYELKIGERTPAGVCIIADYTADSKAFQSITTARHVDLAKTPSEGANIVVFHPLVWESSPMSAALPF